MVRPWHWRGHANDMLRPWLANDVHRTDDALSYIFDNFLLFDTGKDNINIWLANI